MTMSKARCPERKREEDERRPPPPILHFRKLPRAGGLLMVTICGGRAAAGAAEMPGPRGRGDTSSSGPVTQKPLSQPTI